MRESYQYLPTLRTKGWCEMPQSIYPVWAMLVVILRASV
jgi:hypothetical protein